MFILVTNESLKKYNYIIYIFRSRLMQVHKPILNHSSQFQLRPKSTSYTWLYNINYKTVNILYVDPA